MNPEDFAENFDLRAPEMLHSEELPFQVYDLLRERGLRLVHSDRPTGLSPNSARDESRGHWFPVRYEESYQIANNWRLFSSDSRKFAPPGTTFGLGPTMITTDPPESTKYKQLHLSYFSPPTVAKLEPAIRSTTNELIDSFIEAGSCDLAADLAWRMPGLVFFTHMVRLPLDGIAQCIAWFDQMLHADDIAVSRAAHLSVRDYLLEQAEVRKNMPPQGDLVDVLLSGEIDGRPFAAEEILDQLYLLVIAGLETTSNAIANTFHYLARNPEVRQQLIDDPDLMPTAIEEFLRMLGSLHGPGASRQVTEDTEFCGHQLPRGSVVSLAYAAVNRDPEEFPEPNRCILDRQPNRHLAFGAGVHRCLGSNLARLELQVAIEEVLRRLPDFRVSDEDGVVFVGGATSRGYVSLPVTFTPGPRSDTSAFAPPSDAG